MNVVDTCRCVLAAALVAGVARGDEAAAAGESKSADAVTAIVGATVHAVSAEPLPDAVIVFEGDVIRRIGARGEAELPPEAKVIDGQGLHLWPGLIDCNTVLGLVEIGSVRGTVDHTESGSANPSVEAWTAVNPSSELIPVARAGGILLAVTAPRGGLVSGRSSLLALDGWTVNDLVRKRVVGLSVAWPAMPRERPTPQPDEPPARDWNDSVHDLATLLDEARVYRAAGTARGGEARDADIAWSALDGVLDEKVPVWVQATTETQIRTALDWAEEAHVGLVLIDGGDGWRCADALAARRVPVVIDPVRLPLRDYEPYDTPFTAAAKLHAAGVRVVFGTGGASDVRELPRLAARAVAYGLPEAVGVRALTLTAAEILGVEDRYGSLEPGKSATCILVEGDLLDVRMRVRRAWIDGREVDLENRHTRLYEKYRGRPRAAG